MPWKLTDGLDVKVEALCREGRQHLQRLEIAESMAAFMEAWEMLPEPRHQWDASEEICQGLADAMAASGSRTFGLDLLAGPDSRLSRGMAAVLGDRRGRC
jgi:hypothetical protein